jgi:thiol:disulfide interchange protein
MELLAYALFIIVLAIPFLVIAAIAAAFVAGIAGIVAGIAKGRLSGALLGVVLMVGSGAAAMMIMHWATSPPTDAATSAHRVVYQTYQELRMQFRAMRWLRDGTLERGKQPVDPPR